MSYCEEVDFSVLKGCVLTDIQTNKCDEIVFITQNGKKYRMYHPQDCCECVQIEDVCGDLNDILGSEILIAECVTNEGQENCSSITWTFYKIMTINAVVTIRWKGESNGYYSESVDFVDITEEDR